MNAAELYSLYLYDLNVYGLREVICVQSLTLDSCMLAFIEKEWIEIKGFAYRIKKD